MDEKHRMSSTKAGKLSKKSVLSATLRSHACECGARARSDPMRIVGRRARDRAIERVDGARAIAETFVRTGGGEFGERECAVRRRCARVDDRRHDLEGARVMVRVDERLR